MKLKIGVIFGGRTVEHEISIITANQAITNMNKEKYEIIPIYISKSGKMYTGKELLDLKEYRNLDSLVKKCEEIVLVNNGAKADIIRVKSKMFSNNVINSIDLAFPIMHGTNGEDGSIQGFLEILGTPYIGPDVLSSSIGMDKIMMRRILKEQKIPSLDYVAFYSLDYIINDEKYIKEIEDKISYPVIVKAGNLGSRVVIKKAKDKNQIVEYARDLVQKEKTQQVISVSENFYEYHVYEKMSAGIGASVYDDCDYDTVYFNEELALDFASWVSGDSMEDVITKPILNEFTVKKRVYA